MVPLRSRRFLLVLVTPVLAASLVATSSIDGALAKVVSNTSIIAVGPAQVSGHVDIGATAARGTSPITQADGLASSGKSWCATFDLSRVPTRWVQGQSQRFIIRAFNCGVMTWPSGHVLTRVKGNLHFTLKPGGYANHAYWLGSVSADLRGGDVPTAGDVSPNHWAIVQVTMTPKFHGRVSLEALMVKDYQFWFDQVTSTPAQFASVAVNVIR